MSFCHWMATRFVPVVFILIIFIVSSVYTTDAQTLNRQRRLAVSGLALVNTDTNKAVKGFNPIKDGATINLAALPTQNLNIRARLRRRKLAKSIAFTMHQQSHFRLDSSLPFSLGGDILGYFNAMTLTPGQYTITATPYRRKRGKGRQGKSSTISFTVINDSNAGPSGPDTPEPDPPADNSPTPPQPTPQPPAEPTPDPGAPALPEFARWESQMLSFGSTNCNNLNSSQYTQDNKLAMTYYDAAWVFYQIADYTGDSYWLSCAKRANTVYSSNYVIPNNGGVPGYWNFPHGASEHFLRTGKNASRNAVVLLSKNAAFAHDATPLSSTAHPDLSREVAYTIMSYLAAERLGEARRSRVHQLADQAFSHMDQWFVLKNAPYVRPFMVALTAHALIEYKKQVGDSRVIPALTRAADWLWNNTWNSAAQAFQYTDRNLGAGQGTEPAPDLNLLIAPMYGWLYFQTGKTRFRDRGDQVFAGGVRNAYLGNGKQFNQNYRWSINYVRWRSALPLQSSGDPE